MTIVLSVFIAYFLGSVSFSYLLTKLTLKADIRKHGSGNAGATNTLRVLGFGPAVLVLVLDGMKGAAAVWIAVWIGAEGWALPFAGLAAIVGHNWPVYFGFRGGKGVATTIGVFLSLFFFPTVYAGIAALVIIAITRYVSVGSLLLILAAPILSLFIGDDPVSFFYFGLFITALSFWRHGSNIKRLVKGTENKIGQKSPSNHEVKAK